MQTATIQIGTKQWNVDVATTDAELTRGLSGLISIPPYTGVLFDLGYERTVTVNTHGMLFPISVVFIGEDLKVTEIVPVLTPGNSITSNAPCRYFLEVNLDEIENISPGNQVTITGYTPTTTVSIISLMMIALVVILMMEAMSEMVKEEAR